MRGSRDHLGTRLHGSGPTVAPNPVTTALLLLAVVLVGAGGSGCQKRDRIFGALQLPRSPSEVEWWASGVIVMHAVDDPEALRRLHPLLSIPLTHLDKKDRWTLDCVPFAVGFRDGRVLVGDALMFGAARETSSFWDWLRARYPTFATDSQGTIREQRALLPILTPSATVQAEVGSISELRDRRSARERSEGLDASGINRTVRRIVSRLPRYVIVQAEGQDKDVPRSSVPSPRISCVALLREPVVIQACIVEWDRYWYIWENRLNRMTPQCVEGRLEPMHVDKVRIWISERDPPAASLEYHCPRLGRWLPVGMVPISEEMPAPVVAAKLTPSEDR